MRRVALVLCAALVAAPIAPGDAAPKRRKGKVVRVERTRGGDQPMPHLCMNLQANGQAYCWGYKPRLGETLTVFDVNGRRGTLAIRGITPQLDACGNETSWVIDTTTTSGDLSQPDWQMVAMGDYPGTSRTHVVNNAQALPVPNGLAGEMIWQALDDDGNDVPELIITYYACDPTGAPSQVYPSGAQCFGYLQGGDGGYRRVRTDIVKQC